MQCRLSNRKPGRNTTAGLTRHLILPRDVAKFSHRLISFIVPLPGSPKCGLITCQGGEPGPVAGLEGAAEGEAAGGRLRLPARLSLGSRGAHGRSRCSGCSASLLGRVRGGGLCSRRRGRRVWQGSLVGIRTVSRGGFWGRRSISWGRAALLSGGGGGGGGGRRFVRLLGLPLCLLLLCLCGLPALRGCGGGLLHGSMHVVSTKKPKQMTPLQWADP